MRGLGRRRRGGPGALNCLCALLLCVAGSAVLALLYFSLTIAGGPSADTVTVRRRVNDAPATPGDLGTPPGPPGPPSPSQPTDQLTSGIAASFEQRWTAKHGPSRRALIFTMDCLRVYVGVAKRGGPSGELRVRERCATTCSLVCSCVCGREGPVAVGCSLERGLAALGFTTDVAQTDGRFGKLLARVAQYDIVFVDQWTAVDSS